jgi:uncharacterized RDD family membrane protein YckC
MAKLDRGYDDFVSGKISEEFWTRKSQEWEAEVQVVDTERARLMQPRPCVTATAAKILELAKQAENLYKAQDPAEQRRLLETVLSNCTFDRGTLCPTYSKPFDLLVRGNETGDWRRGWDSSQVATSANGASRAMPYKPARVANDRTPVRKLAERVGFEPTCPLRDKTLSRRPRYDHFGTSPWCGSIVNGPSIIAQRLDLDPTGRPRKQARLKTRPYQVSSSSARARRYDSRQQEPRMPTPASTALSSPGELSARLEARLLDVLVLLAIDGVLGQVTGYGFNWLFIAAAIVLAYFTLFDAMAGATPGKLVLGLRVIGPEGGKPSLQQSLAREAFTIVGAVPFAGPFLALAAWIWIGVSIRHSPLGQGKHDLIAGGTRVVRTGTTGKRQRPMTSDH